MPISRRTEEFKVCVYEYLHVLIHYIYDNIKKIKIKNKKIKYILQTLAILESISRA